MTLSTWSSSTYLATSTGCEFHWFLGLSKMSDNVDKHRPLLGLEERGNYLGILKFLIASHTSFGAGFGVPELDVGLMS